VIGMVGRLGDAARAGQLGFARAGDKVALAGPFKPSLAASELAKLHGEPLPDGLAAIDLEAVLTAQGAVREAVAGGALSSAHDLAEGGLAVSLSESCLAGALGARVELAEGSAQELFGECSGAFLVSGPAAALAALGERTPLRVLGEVGGAELSITAAAQTHTWTLAELGQAHAQGLRRHLG
jgi:phosphoribosylformylglycinamidine synthase subunit PurL